MVETVVLSVEVVELDGSSVLHPGDLGTRPTMDDTGQFGLVSLTSVQDGLGGDSYLVDLCKIRTTYLKLLISFV